MKRITSGTGASQAQKLQQQRTAVKRAENRGKAQVASSVGRTQVKTDDDKKNVSDSVQLTQPKTTDKAQEQAPTQAQEQAEPKNVATTQAKPEPELDPQTVKQHELAGASNDFLQDLAGFSQTEKGRDAVMQINQNAMQDLADQGVDVQNVAPETFGLAVAKATSKYVAQEIGTIAPGKSPQELQEMAKTNPEIAFLGALNGKAAGVVEKTAAAFGAESLQNLSHLNQAVQSGPRPSTGPGPSAAPGAPGQPPQGGPTAVADGAQQPMPATGGMTAEQAARMREFNQQQQEVQQIWMQMLADQQKSMMDRLKIMQDLQTEMYKMFQEVALQRKSVYNSLNTAWRKAIFPELYPS